MSPITRSGQKWRQEQAARASVPRRRSSAEVETLILEAVLAQFSVAGYAGATTRGIAASAQVNEALIFRYFGSKAGLYQAAAVEPATRPCGGRRIAQRSRH
jgi:AcrR family transcriptional regulator